MTIGVISLGCAKNLVDTERMLGLLTGAGHELVSHPDKAEVLIVNTCGFIESAKQESINTILEMAAYKKTGRCKKLIVTGCLSQRYREQLAELLPEVDLFLGVREYEALPGYLSSGKGEALCPGPGTKRVLTTPPYSAYLRVGDGCDNRCAYCAIPLIRGPLKSEPMEALVAEAEELAGRGVTELTCIAQDTSGYGVDLYGNPRLMELMERLSRIEGLHWIRVLYTYPDTVTPELIDRIGDNEKIVPYLDMPLQHVNEEVLRRMHRRGTRSHIEKVMDHIEKNAPGFILRTTMMVGFPGETEAAFEEMLAFLKDHPFDRVGAFAFSPEEGTEAALMADQVSEEVKRRRLDRLMTEQKQISLRRNQRRVGSDTEVLVEGREGKYTWGRSYGEAPDVDGRILLPYDQRLKPGQYIEARVTAAGEYDLFAQRAGGERKEGNISL